MDGKLKLCKNIILFTAGFCATFSLNAAYGQTGPAKFNLSTSSAKEGLSVSEIINACVQKERQKGKDQGSAFEICDQMRPECSADGLPMGCVLKIRVPGSGGDAASGAAPTKK